MTVKLGNTAPPNLPPYVTIRLASTRHDPVGSERLYVALYATDGAQLLGVTANGTPQLARLGSEEGHPRYEVGVTIDAGTTTTLVYRLIEPRSSDDVVMWAQPGIWPVTTAVTGKRC